MGREAREQIFFPPQIWEIVVKLHTWQEGIWQLVTRLTQELVIHPKASQKCLSQQPLLGSDLGESRDLSQLYWGEGVEGRVMVLLLFN